jgi:hypothetical protein
MRHTISTIAIVASTFMATFAFAPAIAHVVSHFSQDHTRIAEVSAPAKQDAECRSPVAKIVAALSHKECK